MATTLKLNGSSTINLNTVGGAIELVDQSWSPAIARRKRNRIGGLVYEETEEEIGLLIRDVPGTDMLVTLASLLAVLDEVTPDRSAVYIGYRPNGSAAASDYLALIREVISVEVPASLNAADNTAIWPVVLRVRRRGAWTPAGTSLTLGTAQTNGVVMSASLGSTISLPSAFSARLAGWDATTTPTIRAGVLVVASGASDIQSLTVSGMTATGYTTTNEAANLGPAATLRYTPTGTSAATSGTVSASPGNGGPYTIALKLRSNGGATTFQIRANLASGGASVSTPYTTIDTSSTQPRVVVLEPAQFQSYAANFTVSLTVIASAALGSLDIAGIWLIAGNRQAAQAVAITADQSISSLSGSTSLWFRMSNPYDALDPDVVAIGISIAPFTYQGALPFYVTGSTVYAVWLAVSSNYWVAVNSSNAAISLQLGGTLYPASLIPT